MKGKEILDMEASTNWTWIMRKIINQKECIAALQPHLIQMMRNMKFSLKQVYYTLIDDKTKVPWHKILCHNLARPKAKTIFWLLCHDKLPTKERLNRFGMVQDTTCRLCGEVDETADHLFFQRKNYL